MPTRDLCATVHCKSHATRSDSRMQGAVTDWTRRAAVCLSAQTLLKLWRCQACCGTDDGRLCRSECGGAFRYHAAFLTAHYVDDPAKSGLRCSSVLCHTPNACHRICMDVPNDGPSSVCHAVGTGRTTCIGTNPSFPTSIRCPDNGPGVISHTAVYSPLLNCEVTTNNIAAIADLIGTDLITKQLPVS
jgi:hypothetical protein